jgi:hypothetical protein
MHRLSVSHRLQGRRQFSLTFARSILISIGKALHGHSLQGIDCQIGVLPDGCGEVDVITMLSKQQEYRRDE